MMISVRVAEQLTESNLRYFVGGISRDFVDRFSRRNKRSRKNHTK